MINIGMSYLKNTMYFHLNLVLQFCTAEVIIGHNSTACVTKSFFDMYLDVNVGDGFILGWHFYSLWLMRLQSWGISYATLQLESLTFQARGITGESIRQMSGIWFIFHSYMYVRFTSMKPFTICCILLSLIKWINVKFLCLCWIHWVFSVVFTFWI